MKLNILALFTLLTLQHSSLTSSHPTNPQTSLPLPSKQIYQFTLPTWIENISARSNGYLLLTLLTTPDLYTLNPTSKSPTPTLLHTFPNVTSLLGITEIFPDKFLIIAGNFSLRTVTGVPGTYSIWSLTFSPFLPPQISKLVDVPEATFLNGITPLPSLPGTVLISDSAQGVVYRLNVFTKKYTQAISSLPEMAPTATPPIGINGLRVFKGFLYWTNTNRATLYRARISFSGSLLPTTPIQTLATDPITMDDFAIQESTGTVWVCSNFGNDLFAVDADGKGGRKTVLGALGQLTVAGDTSVVFGRGRTDKEVVYVVTGGAVGSPVNGTVSEGGKVVAVDVGGFGF